MTDPLDLLIIGAGAPGIGSAAILKAARPNMRIAILDAATRPGGTWATPTAWRVT